jgi:hypothetical protein
VLNVPFLGSAHSAGANPPRQQFFCPFGYLQSKQKYYDKKVLNIHSWCFSIFYWQEWGLASSFLRLEMSEAKAKG